MATTLQHRIETINGNITSACDTPTEDMRIVTCNKYSSDIGLGNKTNPNECIGWCNLNVEAHLTNIKLGGENVLVIIDSFPLGYGKYQQDPSIRLQEQIILCFAEIKNITPRYYFEFLRNNVDYHSNSILELIQTAVLPGSIIVLDNVFIGLIDALRITYPTVVTVDMLTVHNTPKENVISNLKEVWKRVMAACDAAKDIHEVKLILMSVMMEQLCRNDKCIL